MDSAQAVVMGEKIYVGGGATKKDNDRYHGFQYGISSDEWSCLPPHPVKSFAMAQFTGNLITVGGCVQHRRHSTGKVYRFKEESQEWEEFLKPMPTARHRLSVSTTQSTIIASGGATVTNRVICTTVEVYSSKSSQWYTANPLPAPYYFMYSVTIADTCYLLGGADSDHKAVAIVLYASHTSLVQKATSPTHQPASHTSVWRTLTDTPLIASTAVCLSGSLLAVGGLDTKTVLPAINIFLRFTNSWVRITTGDLPQPRYSCTAVQLSSNTTIVIGGEDNQNNHTKTVFIGTVTV